VGGELIVQFLEGVTSEQVEAIARQAGALVIRRIPLSIGEFYLLGVPRGEELAFAERLASFPEVVAASVNAVFCPDEDPLPLCGCCPCGLICQGLPACGADGCPGEVPDGHRTPGIPLSVELLPAGELALSWSASCQQCDSDFVIYEGALGEFRSHAPRACSTGGQTSAVVKPAFHSTYYFVAPRNLANEGSHGAGSNRVERPPGVARCLEKKTNGCPGCPHGLCELGVPLATTCDPCVARICEVDSFCCEEQWDELCVSAVSSVCGRTDCLAQQCEQAGGYWTECGPPSPECFCPGVPCIALCVSECLCGGSAGYTCPAGESCNVAFCSPDGIGICSGSLPIAPQ
jgi:hypothetical protein